MGHIRAQCDQHRTNYTRSSFADVIRRAENTTTTTLATQKHTEPPRDKTTTQRDEITTHEISQMEVEKDTTETISLENLESIATNLTGTVVEEGFKTVRGKTNKNPDRLTLHQRPNSNALEAAHIH